ncbi:uncharacterized protein LOC135149493 [Daucus carota subsp. sativus]|uniref:uncharacterized protein LOC135149493 n=1 Tax=Daucus carota subsp. sativus TaxID=79200 RepID=UPI003082B96F
MAEYEALVAGLRLAKEMKFEILDIYNESMVVVRHWKGGFHWNGIQIDARGFNSPLLKCIDGEECNYIMWEIYEGICGQGGGVKYVVVAVDYFTKWGEAEPLASISARKIKDFVHKSIVCRYGIPFKLISDNGKHFDSKALRDFCEALGIKKDFSAVCHPQSNGQTEAINKIIKHTLKAKLEEAKDDWPEELP